MSTYAWERFALGPNTSLVEFDMRDADEIPDLGDLRAAAEEVRSALAAGKKTLVHCQAGLNRSALVAALALTLDGMSAADAIDLLREKRCNAVLCNPTFDLWLREQRTDDG